MILLTACILGVLQYGMVLVFGVIVHDLDDYYGLTTAEGDVLYSYLNFGSCALSFLPGILYDRLGASSSMVIGTIIGIFPVGLQLTWSPAFPAWLSTFGGLKLCYLFAGFSSSFFNVIGCCAPMAAFDEKDLGKVSAAVQICLSLGISVQSAVFAAIKSMSKEFIEDYLSYSLIFLASCGTIMATVFKACEDLIGANFEDRAKAPRTPIKETVCNPAFAYMSFLFAVAIGFCFSFLDVEARIAAEADVDASSLSISFGMINCIGRVATSLPLDFTRHHRFGGVQTYIFVSLGVFASGLLCLAVPAEPGAMHVFAANALAALGYGGLLGIIPPALRLQFGTDNLGMIYGVLYFWVAGSVPIWAFWDSKPDSCFGVKCYREYCLGGVFGMGLTMAATVPFILAPAFRSNDKALPENLHASLLGKAQRMGGEVTPALTTP